MRCDTCHPLLLDHLYGVLDPADAAAVDAHLADCPACAAALDHAERVRGMLARAARAEFPHVRFTPPVEPATPSTVTQPVAAPRRRAWAGWAVAAGVLALVPGTLLPLHRANSKYDHACREAGAAATQLADARGAVEAAARAADDRHAAAKANVESVLAEWVAAETAADLAAKDRPGVRVTRPLAAQPGAPADFAVALDDQSGALSGKRVEAEVRDGAGAVVFTQRIDPAAGDARVHLPAGVWAMAAAQAELVLAVAATDERTGAREYLRDPVSLFGPVYSTMLVTDKATYRPGERVLFRSLTLDRVSFRPPAREQVLHYALHKPDGVAVPGAELWGTTAAVRVADGRVEPVRGPDGGAVRGVGCGAFALPAGLADGDYTLILTELPGRDGEPPAIRTPVRRTVKVRAGAAERYAKRITFKSAAVAPGQAIEAVAEILLAGKPVAGAAVAAVATADGNGSVVVRPQATKTGADGRATFRVALPPAAEMPAADVRLMVTFKTADATESVAERVPVAGRDVTVEFFPEGGKLVAGVPNRVYVRATAPGGRAVDVRGSLTAGGETLTRVESATDGEPGVNRGIASFTLTPNVGATYKLTLDGRAAPGFDLPKAEADGVAMTVPRAVAAPGEPVRVRLYSAGKPRNLVVGAYTRGRVADTQRVTVKPGEAAEVALAAPADRRGGVTRVTVFEQPTDATADLIPVAERLVFRTPGEGLNLALKSSAGGDVAVAATDEAGNPAAAVVWAAVVNAAAAPGTADRALPTHFLLAGEVETPDGLEYADFLLSAHPKAAAALDAVLATQGWRRFVEQGGPGKTKPDAARLLVLNGQYPVTDAAPAGDHRRLHDAYWPRYESAVAGLGAARTATAGSELRDEYEARHRALGEHVAAARAAAEPLAALRGWEGVAAGGVGLLAAALWVVALTRSGGVRAAAPLLVAAVAAGALTAFLALDAADPVPDPDIDADALVLPPAPVAPAGTDPKRPDVRHTPAEYLITPPPSRVVVEGPLAPAIVPRILSTVGSPADPPKLPAPAKASGVVVPAIPDDFLRPGAAPQRPRVTPALGAGGAEVQAVTAFATGRWAALAGPIEAALAAQKSGAADRVRAAVPVAPPLLVREYAAPRPGATADTAADTVLWQPLIVLPTDGKTTLPVPPGPAPGGCRVLVAGHTADGRLGSASLILPPASK